MDLPTRGERPKNFPKQDKLPFSAQETGFLCHELKIFLKSFILPHI